MKVHPSTRTLALMLVVALPSGAAASLRAEEPATAPAPAAAPAAATPAVPATPAAAPATKAGDPAAISPSDVDREQPNVSERRIVAYVASGVTAAALVAGVVFGVVAQTQFNCIQDVVACNKGLADPIVGDELFDARADVERFSVLADGSYLLAGVGAVVATAAYLRGFVFTGEDADAGTPAPVSRVQPLKPMPREVRTAAYISLGLWLLVAACGRSIAYF